MAKKKVMLVFGTRPDGTRPEAIKMYSPRPEASQENAWRKQRETVE